MIRDFTSTLNAEDFAFVAIGFVVIVRDVVDVVDVVFFVLLLLHKDVTIPLLFIKFPLVMVASNVGNGVGGNDDVAVIDVDDFDVNVDGYNVVVVVAVVNAVVGFDDFNDFIDVAAAVVVVLFVLMYGMPCSKYC